MFSACIWFSLVSTAWLFDENPIRCLHPWGLWCCELCRVSFQSERLRLNNEKGINDESSQPFNFLDVENTNLGCHSCTLLPTWKSLVPIRKHWWRSHPENNHWKCNYFLKLYLSPSIPCIIIVGCKIVGWPRWHVGLWDAPWGLQMVKPEQSWFQINLAWSHLRLFMCFLPSSSSLNFCMNGPISLVAPAILSATNIFLPRKVNAL